jgi:hypothetical protein
MDKNSDNIRGYFEEVKDNYPDVDFEHFKMICLNPFKYVKEVMSSGVLKNIRLQYFGTFEVSSSRVKYSKKSLLESLSRGTVSQERYDKRMQTLNNYEG